MHRAVRSWPLLLLALAMLASGLGMRDPWPPDEPRFALVAREMVQTGEWLFPHRNGELYAEKPPLFLWLVAAAESVVGERAGYALPSLIAGLCTLLLVVDLGRRLWNRRVGLLAGAALLCATQFVWQSRVAQIDAVLVLWTTLALYGLLRHLALGPAWGWLHIAFLAMGAGVISKGVGFLPVLVVIPFLVLRGRRPEALPAGVGGWRWGTAALCLLAVIAAWVVPMLLAVERSGDPALAAYRDNLLLRQTATRYANSWHHGRPPWYFLLQAPVLWLPLSLLLPWALPAWWRRLRRRDVATTLLLGWIVLLLLFFSLPKGKRGVYIYPALPALALALAPLLPGLLRRRDVRIAAFALAATVAGALLVGAAASLAPALRERLAAVRIDAVTLTLPLAVAGLGALACCWFARVRRGALALVGVLAIGWTVGGAAILPRLNDARYPAALMAEADALAGPDGELAMIEYREQYVLAAPRGLTTFGYATPAQLQLPLARDWVRQRPGRLVLIPGDRVGPLGLEPARLIRLGRAHGEDWMVADAAALGGAPALASRP